MIRDRNHFSKETTQTKTRLEIETKGHQKTKDEILEYKDKYEHLVQLITRNLQQYFPRE
jgi:hypothetical protein